MKTENQNSREKTGPGAVERQEAPPFGKSVEIAYKSIRVRFFRSLITTMTLVLAVRVERGSHFILDIQALCDIIFQTEGDSPSLCSDLVNTRGASTGIARNF